MTVSAVPYELVIGIETHVELRTESKMFCGCQARWFGAPPNTLVCPVCLGLPGALPVPNRKAIELAITAGLALHCETPEHTKFDRKNYLYPDLPKGYQISQYDLPLSVKGWLELPTGKRIRVTRAHLEEDTGTLKHGEDAGRRYTLVDFNRSGVPLLEIVSEPDMSSAEEGEAYVRALRDILIFSGVSEMRLEEGAGRFDVNVSIRFQENGKTQWPPQSEIKNLNSYQALRGAVAYESDRLWQEWRSGGEIRTRTGKITVGWSPERGRTYLQRSKEDVEDYRYFPEPDLVSLSPSPEMIAKLREGLPEMPAGRRARFVSDYGLSDYDARILVADRAVADYFETAVKAGAPPKATANWVMGDLTATLKREGVGIGSSRVNPYQLADFVQLVVEGTVSSSSAKTLFSEMWKSRGEPKALVDTLGLAQVSDEVAIAAAVDEVIEANPRIFDDYKRGNARALSGLVGPVMRRLGNKANPTIVNELLVARARDDASSVSASPTKFVVTLFAFSGGADLKLEEELSLLKSALLYADEVILVDPKVSFVTLIERYRASSSGAQKDVVLRMVEQMPEARQLVGQLRPLLKKRNRTKDELLFVASLETAMEKTRSRMDQILAGMLEPAETEEFGRALKAGVLRLDPLSSRTENPTPEEISEFMAEIIAGALRKFETYPPPLVPERGSWPRGEPVASDSTETTNRLVTRLIEVLLPGNTTYAMFDEHMAELAAATNHVVRRAGLPAEAPDPEAFLGTEFLSPLDVFPHLRMDELLDVRNQLSPYVARYRKALTEFAADIKTSPLEPEFRKELRDLYVRRVGPALEEMQEREREMGLVALAKAELASSTSGRLAKAAFGIWAAHTAGLEAIGQAIAAAVVPVADAAAAIYKRRRELAAVQKQNTLYFAYSAQRLIAAARKG